MISLSNSYNCIVKLLFQHALHGSGSGVASSINFLWHRYMHDKTNVGHSKFNVPAELTPSEECQISAGLIRDFALYRDSLPFSQCNNQLPEKSDIQDILTYLCTA